MREAIFKIYPGRSIFRRWSSSILHLGELSFSQFRAPLFLFGNSGQPDSVWRPTGCLWKLCVKYSLDFLKADFVGRLFVTVRRFIVTQNKKQRPAIKSSEGSATPNIILQIKNGMSSGTKVDTNATNQPPEQKRDSRFDSCQVVPLLYKEE